MCIITPEFNIPEHVEVNSVNQKPMVTPLVICLPRPMPYASEKARPYNYNATMLENGREVPIPHLPSVVNITEDSRVLRNGRIMPTLFQKKAGAPVTEQIHARDSNTTKDAGQTSGTNTNADFEELLQLIKKSEYKVIDQLMQTPSKISILSLLLNSEAHRNALMKVLNQAFVSHDITIGQFDGIVGNIIACNNLSFSDEELPEEGRTHNMTLHISVNCNTDALSNVLVDTGSSLNVMAKTAYNQLSFESAPLKRSDVRVKAFDGSRKNVLGEVDLPITIGPHVFQITFQVMDIQASYSCLLGRPWIHEAGAVTSTLHQKLKFVKNGKLVTVGGEQAMLVSHLSSFSFIGADIEDGTSFQGLSIEDQDAKKKATSISSFKDAQKVVQDGVSTGWGKVVNLSENKRREGLGFTPSVGSSNSKPMGNTFYSAGFIHASSEANAIIEDNPEGVPQSFVTQGGISRNWVAVDVPFVAHLSK